MLLDFIHKLNPLNKGWLTQKENIADAKLIAKEEEIAALETVVTERKNRIVETATRLEQTAKDALADFHRFEGQQ